RGVRDARLHQRRTPGGRPAARQPDGRESLLRHHADGAPRALPRGRRAHPQGLAGARDLLVERAVLPARHREPVAAPDPGAAPAGVDPGIGQHQHLRLRRRARRLLLLPELFRRQVGEDDDGRLLARGGREGARPQSLSRGLPAARRRGRERRARRGEVRAARRVLLSQVPARARDVVLAAGQPGLSKPRRDAEQPGAPRRESQEPPLPGLRREGLRHRRQPRDRARSPEGGSHQELARGQPDGPPPDRLDAARARAREHRALRPRGAAGPPRCLGGRELGKPLVARAAAPARPGAAGRDRGGRRMSVRVEAPLVAGAEERTVTVWQGRVRMRIVSKGRGPALVFFHGPWGLTWDPFLDELAASFTVVAPEHPGTTPEAHDDIYHLDGLWDLVLCYDELLDSLGLRNAAFVGHSFGGMIACEMAAAYPERVRRLAMIAPLGFWRDPDRIVNWMMLEPGALRAHIFRDPDGAAARRRFPKAEAQDEAATASRVRLVWAMGTTGKFIWPIPDKGLKKRIHRVKAPSLLVWGREDRLVPVAYADEFTRRLSGARVQM